MYCVVQQWLYRKCSVQMQTSEMKCFNSACPEGKQKNCLNLNMYMFWINFLDQLYNIRVYVDI